MVQQALPAELIPNYGRLILYLGFALTQSNTHAHTHTHSLYVIILISHQQSSRVYGISVMMIARNENATRQYRIYGIYGKMRDVFFSFRL